MGYEYMQAGGRVTEGEMHVLHQLEGGRVCGCQPREGRIFVGHVLDDGLVTDGLPVGPGELRVQDEDTRVAEQVIVDDVDFDVRATT
ncbi:hypothetical protein [Nannocystis sp.]|uniref:hypothetical protein n=1 Tax=Nannocystis sp. TaxID=1962667 RepID=UPI0025D55139|nr:hypothetical protein [Nannocystis sp.]